VFGRLVGVLFEIIDELSGKECCVVGTIFMDLNLGNEGSFGLWLLRCEDKFRGEFVKEEIFSEFGNFRRKKFILSKGENDRRKIIG
jgi:hypothetical protein